MCRGAQTAGCQGVVLTAREPRICKRKTIRVQKRRYSEVAVNNYSFRDPHSCIFLQYAAVIAYRPRLACGEAWSGIVEGVRCGGVKALCRRRVIPALLSHRCRTGACQPLSASCPSHTRCISPSTRQPSCGPCRRLRISSGSASAVRSRA